MSSAASANTLQPPTYEPTIFVTSLPITDTQTTRGSVTRIPEWMKSGINATAVKEAQEKSVRRALREDGPPEQMKLAKLMDSAYNSAIRKSKMVEQMGGGSNDIVGNEPTATTVDVVVGSEAAPLVPIHNVIKGKGKSGVAKQHRKRKQGDGGGKGPAGKQRKKSTSSSSAKKGGKTKRRRKSTGTGAGGGGKKRKKSTAGKKRQQQKGGSHQNKKKKQTGGAGKKTIKKKKSMRVRRTRRKATKRPKSQKRRYRRKNSKIKAAAKRRRRRGQTAKRRLMF